ncbi:ABC transporter ATP-binding protein [Lachnospiraceae bacterium MD1]|uniref:ABC transporter ATP-binding protein n=1 Tax=Variimorphobacter saccharofermentans TaxID=2755051 RepID=A0A839K2X1_9FIRM|nr:ABC transporter ATP-binding protein [Variimorphobacter saccharofermentans]MBB2183728.1 ABC transporter ATP-binding protein [Variimorphobacter saccharofermentans]
MNQVIIRTKSVSKSFILNNQEIPVLKNIDLNIQKGEFVSIMGPSGSGKSTLLYLLGGLENATKGSIEINTKNIADLNDDQQSKMRRQEIGFVFQSYNLIPNLTVEENILIPLLLEGKKKKDLEAKLNDILDIVGLSAHRNHTPKELSGGQQQRVAIARAIITDPEILFADEPIGNLDSVTGIGILELLRKINQEKKTTIVMVTHSEESTRYGTRVIRLKDGMIID